MAPSISLYISSTLDGFIARADGAIDWLTRIDENDTDYGYAAYYDSIDGLIMGSTTFELIRSLGPWPYPSKPTFVFTRRSLRVEGGNIHFVTGDPQQVVGSQQFLRFKRLWLVGGSALIASCLKRKLIDEYILTVLPVLLGHGLRLFPSPIAEQWLSLASCRTYERGVLQLHYRKIGIKNGLPPVERGIRLTDQAGSGAATLS
ncbi:MAG: dihydrofolate reductase [Chitinispirillaceae bacterium]|nr:dihydrofolate reductase [Chitinispirillaceae bacterium]